MVQFTSFASVTYVFSYGYKGKLSPPLWVAPFGNPRIKACLTAPRGLSQLATSFIAFRNQGIHHTLLVA